MFLANRDRKAGGRLNGGRGGGSEVETLMGWGVDFETRCWVSDHLP